MNKQKACHDGESILELFDEVRIKPDVYPGYSTGDETTNHNYFVIKKYIVELGGDDVPFVDILRHSGQECSGDLKENELRQNIMAMPRWTKPFILSFPTESIIHAS
jgi:hypothetical protein